MHRSLPSVCALLVLGLASGTAASEPGPDVAAARSDDWKLVRQSEAPGEAYALFARPRAGSAYAEYRMEIAVAAAPADVLAALEHNTLDPDTHPSGFRRTLLRREAGLMVSHDYIGVPFVSDRDVVIRTVSDRDPESGALRMRWSSTDAEGPAPREGVVRMPSSEGSWTLHPDGDGTRVVYWSHIDLGGSLPAAFVESRMPAEIADQAAQLHRTLAERQVVSR